MSHMTKKCFTIEKKSHIITTKTTTIWHLQNTQQKHLKINK